MLIMSSTFILLKKSLTSGGRGNDKDFEALLKEKCLLTNDIHNLDVHAAAIYTPIEQCPIIIQRPPLVREKPPKAIFIVKHFQPFIIGIIAIQKNLVLRVMVIEVFYFVFPNFYFRSQTIFSHFSKYLMLLCQAVCFYKLTIYV